MTDTDWLWWNYTHISIHTFPAEGDPWGVIFMPQTLNFNPHLPNLLHMMHRQFQSTPSLRKVTFCSWLVNVCLFEFQSTPSLRKVTVYALLLIGDVGIFQSTPSLRKVTLPLVFVSCPEKFQSTPSLWKVTKIFGTSYPISTFQSTPSLRKVT